MTCCAYCPASASSYELTPGAQHSGLRVSSRSRGNIASLILRPRHRRWCSGCAAVGNEAHDGLIVKQRERMLCAPNEKGYNGSLLPQETAARKYIRRRGEPVLADAMSLHGPTAIVASIKSDAFSMLRRQWSLTPAPTTEAGMPPLKAAGG